MLECQMFYPFCCKKECCHWKIMKTSKVVAPEPNKQKHYCLLPRRGKRAYSCFCQALENSYPWLLTALKNLQITEEEEEKKVTSDKMSQPLTNEMVDMLRQNVQLVRRWHMLAHSLGMSAQRTQIQVQANLYMWDMEQCVLQLLEQWKSLKGNSATLGALLESLRKEQFNDIADKLEEEFIQ
ncbi:uncharacterized protein LOC143233353 isoform X2 [Tachypleus tridentatus]|uniref:uncharacterized protein LOC143233353 isoform X2 n=1 Tax=Tachypleus tridentatus TaxID=6853 RepID=UPI003FD119B7